MTAPGLLPGAPGPDEDDAPAAPSGRPAVIDLTDGRLSAVRGAAASGGAAPWIPSARTASSAGRSARAVSLSGLSGPSASVSGSIPGAVEVGEVRAPGGATLIITGLEARPPRPPRRGGPGGRPSPRRTGVPALVVLDAVALGAGWATSALVPLPGRAAVPEVSGLLGMPGARGLAGLAAAQMLWCVLIAAGGGYAAGEGARSPARAVRAAAVRFTAAAALLLLAVSPDVARQLVVAVPIGVGGALALRSGARLAMPSSARRPVRVLLVGGAAAVDRAARRLAVPGAPGKPGGRGGPAVRVVGRCVTGEPVAGTADVGEPPTAVVGEPPTAVVGEPPTAVVGEPPTADVDATDVLRRRVTATARATGADMVLLADGVAFPAPSLRRLAWTLHASGVGLGVAAGPSGVAATRLRVRSVADLPVLEVEPPVFTGVRRVLKSLFDRCGALALLVVFAPLILGVAVAVRLSGPGPVIFRQERVGRHGERFVMFKFRSMCAEAPVWRNRLEACNDHGSGVLFKMRADPRVTAVGRILRRMSLDELPQLVNVLRGEMSLVGPRPALPAEVERYEPDVLRRLLVKPGLTGLWQVSGRSDLDWPESVRLDLGYVENWSFGLDLDILRRTARAVVRGTGAR